MSTNLLQRDGGLKWATDTRRRNSILQAESEAVKRVPLPSEAHQGSQEESDAPAHRPQPQKVRRAVMPSGTNSETAFRGAFSIYLSYGRKLRCRGPTNLSASRCLPAGGAAVAAAARVLALAP